MFSSREVLLLFLLVAMEQHRLHINSVPYGRMRKSYVWLFHLALYLDCSCYRHMPFCLLADQPGPTVCVSVMVVGIPQDFLSLLGTNDALQSMSHADYSCLAVGFLKEPYQPSFQKKMFDILYSYPSSPNLPRIFTLDMDVKFYIKYLFSICRYDDIFFSSKLLLRIVLSPRFIKYFSFASWHSVKLCQQRTLERIFQFLLSWLAPANTQLLQHPLSCIAYSFSLPGSYSTGGFLVPGSCSASGFTSTGLLQYGQFLQHPAASQTHLQTVLQQNGFCKIPTHEQFSLAPQRVDFEQVPKGGLPSCFIGTVPQQILYQSLSQGLALCNMVQISAWSWGQGVCVCVWVGALGSPSLLGGSNFLYLISL